MTFQLEHVVGMVGLLEYFNVVQLSKFSVILTHPGPNEFTQARVPCIKMAIHMNGHRGLFVVI